MTPRLTSPARDLELRPSTAWNGGALTTDLALDEIVRAAARDDKLIEQVVRRELLEAATNANEEEILHRQAVVRDALANPGTVREIYDLAGQAIEDKRRNSFGIWGDYPSSVLHGAIDVMRIYVGALRRLRDLTRAHVGEFNSAGFRNLFAMLDREFDEEYLARIEAHLADLKFPSGALMSAELGAGNRGRRYVLHRVRREDLRWWRRFFSRRDDAFSFRLADRDEAGARALSEIRDRGVRLVAKVLAESADHVDVFFRQVRAELAFVMGSVNLHQRLAELGASVCFPTPRSCAHRRLAFQELYDPCLALHLGREIVGNAAMIVGKSLVLITGANQGGKSTFLRSLGVAQLMMQAGMFVSAGSFEGAMCTGLMTHFKREEDAELKSGKLDEELVRMSEIIDQVTPNALILFNESFAATNEREGSEIAEQVVSSLVDAGVRVAFVTHLHAFARGFVDRRDERVLFLRPERRADGTRTFRLREGEPLATSYGRDLYERIFEVGSPRASDAAGTSGAEAN